MLFAPTKGWQKKGFSSRVPKVAGPVLSQLPLLISSELWNIISGPQPSSNLIWLSSNTWPQPTLPSIMSITQASISLSRNWTQSFTSSQPEPLPDPSFCFSTSWSQRLWQTKLLKTWKTVLLEWPSQLTCGPLGKLFYFVTLFWSLNISDRPDVGFIYTQHDAVLHLMSKHRVVIQKYAQNCSI